MNKKQEGPSALEDLMGNKYSRKGIKREWYKALPAKPGGLTRMVCRILRKSQPSLESFDLASLRVFNADASPGYFYIKALPSKDLDIDTGIERYNAENIRALRGEVIDPALLHHIPEMKEIACVTYTNLIIRNAEYIADGGMARFETVLYSPAFASEYTLTGPRSSTKELSLKRWEHLFYAMYPGCDFQDPGQQAQATPEEIREVMDSLPPLD